MIWQFIRRHRRKFFFLSLLAGGGYAAFRFLNGKLSIMINEQEKMIDEWKKQLYYEHNRDTSLKTSTEIFTQVVININRAFECEIILDKLSKAVNSAEKRQLWEELRVECFARLLTYAYSSSFVLALTELVVSALSGRLYAQSQQLAGQNHTNTTAGAVSATTKSSHAESVQEHSSLLSREVQLACLDVIRYTTESGMNYLIEDVRKATQSILSRVPLQQMLDVNDVIWYCSEIRHQIEKKRFHTRDYKDHPLPLLKYVRSNSNSRRMTTSYPITTNDSAYSLSNSTITTNSLFTNHRSAPPPIFNLQQQFHMECVEMIESDSFQRVLHQIVDQSFNNIYDNFARAMAKGSMKTSTITDNEENNSSIINDPQLPFAKIIPISNNIYSTVSNTHQGLLFHFQSLACRPELHEYTKYVYELFSNESSKSPSRTAYSFLPIISPSSLQSNISAFIQSWMGQ